MSSAETNYSFITDRPDLLVRGRAQTVEMRVERAGAVIAVTEAGSTFSLIKPDGTALIDAVAVDCTAAGVPQYAILAATLPATLTPLGEGWQEVWTLVLPDGTTRTVDREAALCLRPLNCPISQTTLLEDYPTLSTFLGSAPNSPASWQGFIDAAWTEILNRLTGEGHLSYLIKSGSAFRRAMKELTYAKGFGWLSLHQAGRGNWADLATKHSAGYEAAWSGINFRTDDNHDGRVDDATQRRDGSGSVLHINVPPVTPSGRLPPRLPWL